jgi:hypothetical protein
MDTGEREETHDGGWWLVVSGWWLLVVGGGSVYLTFMPSVGL